MSITILIFNNLTSSHQLHKSSVLLSLISFVVLGLVIFTSDEFVFVVVLLRYVEVGRLMLKKV